MSRNSLLKKLLAPSVRVARQPVDRLIATLSTPRRLWARRRATEVAFWKRWVQTRGDRWESDWIDRLRPDSELQPPIADLVSRVPSSEVSILDVGAGPLTILGKCHPTKRLSITAIDPLAAEYDRILSDAGIAPPVRTVYGMGEILTEQFGPDTFDIAYAQNALDHSFDPVEAIRGMTIVARHFVVLCHERNEAENERYRGMHNWNLDIQDGRFVIWNLRERHDVEARVGRRPDIREDVRGWITVTFDLRDDAQ
ncbi:MAG: hypothetical protein ACRDKT_17325 [Actinomycetota bacterium]